MLKFHFLVVESVFNRHHGLEQIAHRDNVIILDARNWFFEVIFIKKFDCVVNMGIEHAEKEVLDLLGERLFFQLSDPGLNQDSPVKGIEASINHSTSGYRGWRSST
jgi:hypothetical protein